jgi:MFS family permease
MEIKESYSWYNVAVRILIYTCLEIFTLNDRISSSLQAILFAASGSIYTGYSLAVVGATLGLPSFYESLSLDPNPISPGYSHTRVILGAINGIFFAGGFFGTLFAGWAGSYFGRVRSFRICASLGIVGGALSAGSVNQAMVISPVPSI